jgi:hypothetical protein
MGQVAEVMLATQVPGRAERSRTTGPEKPYPASLVLLVYYSWYMGFSEFGKLADMLTNCILKLL